VAVVFVERALSDLNRFGKEATRVTRALVLSWGESRRLACEQRELISNRFLSTS
jgi:hypothetical protein